MKHSTRRLRSKYVGWIHGGRRGIKKLRSRLSPSQLVKREVRIARRKAAR